MMRFVWLLLALSVLVSCGNVNGKPLPLVEKDDPTWALVPDHLENGALPR